MPSSNWWMFHGDPAHTGEATGSAINSGNVAGLTLTQSINVNGSVLSTPAVVDGYVYVGLPNSLEAAAPNGGLFPENGPPPLKIAAPVHRETDPAAPPLARFLRQGINAALLK